jgi:hypothetical protein
VRFQQIPGHRGQYCTSGYSIYTGYQGTACENIQ